MPPAPENDPSHLGLTTSIVSVRMHFESSRELYAGSADVPVRNAPPGARVFVSKIGSFRASRSVRTRTSALPAKLRLLNSETASVPRDKGLLISAAPSRPESRG